jgi:NAD+ diphosphatase
MAAPRSQPNPLAGRYLNRLAEWRKDEARLRAALEDPTALVVPVWRSRSLVIQHTIEPDTQSLGAYFLTGVGSLGPIDPTELIFLGQYEERVCFAVELTPGEEPRLADSAEFRDLRTIAGELPAAEAGVLAYARAMVTWRERHRFCGKCGAPTMPIEGGHVLRCSAPSCATQTFPRIDPAIIVLIHDGERALLGRQASWPPRWYSTIAGFVEPGESLEDAVVREAKEETGVDIDVVDYHSSQPWPFPSSLMIGFLAHAATTDIDLGDAELEDARWLTREQIAAGEIALPPPHSISFRLVEEWYDASAAVPLRDSPNMHLWRSAFRR